MTGALTTLTRADGTTQVAYDGLPLYDWQGDAKPGDVTGDGVNGFSVGEGQRSRVRPLRRLRAASRRRPAAGTATEPALPALVDERLDPLLVERRRSAPSWPAAGRARSAAAAFARAWSGVFAPGIVAVTASNMRIQRSAIWARVAPAGHQLAQLLDERQAGLVVDAGERLAHVERFAVPVVQPVVGRVERGLASTACR